MSKLLVADYDGTYLHKKDDLEEIKINKKRTEDFIRDGNIFSFATGRNFKSIKDEIDRFDLPYQYLVCNNGTSIFDEKNQLIHYSFIPFNIVIKTINYLNRKKIIVNYKFNDIYGKTTDVFTEVAEIVCEVKIPDALALESVKDELSFLQTIYFTSESSQVHTIAGNFGSDCTQYLVIKVPSDKKNAIRFIAEREKIDSNSIYTIGNDFNDYGMLECYNGYKMEDSRMELDLLDIPTIGSVHELIKRIER